jgi:hypothetical protein
LGLQESTVRDGFKVVHVLRDLLALLRNITALLDARCDRLYLHFAVDVRQEVLLGQVLIVRKLSTHNRRLLHVAPGPHLLHRLRRILLQLVHLVNQHDIFHIGNLIRLLLDPLLLVLILLLHRVLVLVHLLVYLLLRPGAARPTRATTFDLVDVHRHRLIHPLLVLVLRRRNAHLMSLHLLRGKRALIRFLQLIPAKRGMLAVNVGARGALFDPRRGRQHDLPLRLLLALVREGKSLTRILVLEGRILDVLAEGLVLLHGLGGEDHVDLLDVGGGHVGVDHDLVIGQVRARRPSLVCLSVVAFISHIQILLCLSGLRYFYILNLRLNFLIGLEIF